MKKTIMMLLLFLGSIATVNAQSGKLSITFVQKGKNKIPVLYLNGKEFVGNKKELLTFEVIKSVQSANNRCIVFHDQVFTEGYKTINHSIFRKKPGGYWEQLVIIRSEGTPTAVDIIDDGVFVTLKNTASELKIYRLNLQSELHLNSGPTTPRYFLGTRW